MEKNLIKELIANVEDNLFPVYYQKDNIRIFTNPSNEIFVEDICTGVKLRINTLDYGGLVFTTEDRVEPIRITNMIGWSITPR